MDSARHSLPPRTLPGNLILAQASAPILNLLGLRPREVLLDQGISLLLGPSFFEATPFILYFYVVFVYVCGGQGPAFRSLSVLSFHAFQRWTPGLQAQRQLLPDGFVSEIQQLLICIHLSFRTFYFLLSASSPSPYATSF